LPLAIALASAGMRVVCYDLSEPAVAAVRSGTMPFREPGAAAPLRAALAAGRLTATTDASVIGSAEHVVITVDGALADVFASCGPYLADGQLVVLRSTAAPGDTARLEKLAAELGIDVDVAFCPERIAEGQAMTELFELPQIISSRTARGVERAASLFRRLVPALVTMSPEEAELANDRGLDFERIREGLQLDYPRGAGLPPAGFAAGPCLLKDTLSLIGSGGEFRLGQAAVAANEGLADYVVDRLASTHDLAGMRVGLLGMAFKGGSDDTRSSLSYRLKRLLAARAREVLCSDPLVISDPDLLPLPAVLAAADLIVVAAPHPQYRDLPAGLLLADIWGVTDRGVRI
jgi:UDP-N-acetyl-D-mannosaminuronic acid dehydrogenase